ncbi:MAG TPA: formate dehydrogenase subunit gamma [Dongiaceae bacterium]|jgi:formate dehydrogenase subunit gamma|nr:formate dehydrogenase subunit gamma [Dongiaceae bacterium]
MSTPSQGASPGAESRWDSAEARRIIESLRGLDGALIPMLHALQDRFGYVDDQAVPDLADVLNVSRAEVHGVLTFYHDFRRTPPARHALHLCRAEACQAVGARAIEAHVKQKLGIDYHHETPDGRWSLGAIYCLGNCACGPSALIDGETYGRLTAEKLDQLMREAEAGRVEAAE